MRLFSLDETCQTSDWLSWKTAKRWVKQMQKAARSLVLGRVSSIFGSSVTFKVSQVTWMFGKPTASRCLCDRTSSEIISPVEGCSLPRNDHRRNAFSCTAPWRLPKTKMRKTINHNFLCADMLRKVTPSLSFLIMAKWLLFEKTANSWVAQCFLHWFMCFPWHFGTSIPIPNFG